SESSASGHRNPWRRVARRRQSGFHRNGSVSRRTRLRSGRYHLPAGSEVEISGSDRRRSRRDYVSSRARRFAGNRSESNHSAWPFGGRSDRADRSVFSDGSCNTRSDLTLRSYGYVLGLGPPEQSGSDRYAKKFAGIPRRKTFG